MSANRPEGVQAAMEMLTNESAGLHPTHRQTLLQYIAALEKAAEWQDISTAPKDYERVLVGQLCNGAWRYIVTASWCEETGFGKFQTGSYTGWYADHAPAITSLERIQSSTNVSGFIGQDFAPTHWRPLPTPPTEATSGRAG